MKQSKLFTVNNLCLLLGMALMASCTTGGTDDEVTQPAEFGNNTNSTEMEMQTLSIKITGVYEGEWILDGQPIGTDKLTVNDETMEFVLPEDSIIARILSISYNDATNSDKPDRYFTMKEYRGAQIVQCAQYSMQGYSEKSNYISMSNSTEDIIDFFISRMDFLPMDGNEIDPRSIFAENIPDMPQGTYFFGFYGMVENNPNGPVTYRTELSGTNGANAIFSFSTGLWTLNLPIEKICVTDLLTGNRVWNYDVQDGVFAKGLIFSATKRIK